MSARTRFVGSTPFVLLGLSLWLAAGTAQLAAQIGEGRSRGPASGGAPAGAMRYYPEEDYSANRWRLGVSVRNLETGVQLTNVVRGGVAERNGLAVGDIVVSVAGYQVGYVDGRLYDLGDELARNVDRRGQVTLLVLRNRDGRLANNYVSFADIPGGGGGGGVEPDRVRVQGEIIGSGLRLSPNAVQVARVIDVTNSQWGKVVVERKIERNPGQFPLDFGMSMQPRTGHKYACDAIIYDRDVMYYTDLDPFPASPGQERNVRLRVVGQRRVADPATWYRKHLGRSPSAQERAVWQEQLESGMSEDEIEAQLLGGSEFFDRNRSNPTEYVRGLTRAAADREPTPEELRRYTQQLQEQGSSRSRLAEQMLEALRAPRQ
jgi:hypothetical protein